LIDQIKPQPFHRYKPNHYNNVKSNDKRNSLRKAPKITTDKPGPIQIWVPKVSV
jgi:hypothetical protein